MTPLESKIMYRLRTSGALDIFQLRDLIHANLHGVRVAARHLNERGLIHISTWHRRTRQRVAVYSAGPGENVDKEDVDLGTRSYSALAEASATIEALKRSRQGAGFDPFRVLRVQVGA
ncbi:hypothetical protein ACOTI8_30545 [Achromobacter xylosoxidans]